MVINLLVVCAMSLLPFLAGSQCYKETYESTNISRHLVVKDKDEIVGYIKGSMHFGFNESELELDKLELQRVLADVNQVYMEIDFNTHWSSLPFGLERALLESCEKSNKTESITYLETIESQRALLNALYSLGKNQYYVPYKSLFIDDPNKAIAVNTVVHISNLFNNIVYNWIINTDAASQRQKEVNSKNLQLRKDFLEGKTGTLDSQEVNLMRIVPRDEYMYKKFLSTQERLSPGDKFLIVIGMSHLSTNKGLLSHFVEAGYTVEEV